MLFYTAKPEAQYRRSRKIVVNSTRVNKNNPSVTLDSSSTTEAARFSLFSSRFFLFYIILGSFFFRNGPHGRNQSHLRPLRTKCARQRRDGAMAPSEAIARQTLQRICPRGGNNGNSRHHVSNLNGSHSVFNLSEDGHAETNRASPCHLMHLVRGIYIR